MRLRSLALLPVLAAVVAGGLAAPAAASPEERAYIVVLKDSVTHPSDVAASHRRDHGARVTHTYGAALKGYAASLTAGAYGEVVRDPRVAYVEPDGTATASSVQLDPTWGLDRIDQRAPELDASYTATATADIVTAYVLDTGIASGHSEFGGRVTSGYSAFTTGGTEDCNGHGTHVAGTIGGRTYGVAKSVKLVAVRVLGCNGGGTWSGVIAGIDWVAAQPARPAVANMSLGGAANRSVDNAVKNAIAKGITFAVAAGNDNANACNYSPARVSEAVTVGATDRADVRAWFSNHGSCLDLFAPGVDITSAWHAGTTGTHTISGTSMAAPHVAGAAALHLAEHRSATPAAVSDALVFSSTKDVVTDENRSPDRLLYNVVSPAPTSTTTTTPKSRK